MLANGPSTLSFYVQGGATAQWLPNHSAIQLTLPNSSSYAVVEFHKVSSVLPTVAPNFATTQYGSGSPRWYIQLSSGAYLFGYPSPASYWAVEACSSVSANSSFTYAEAVAAITGTNCAGTVTAVYIVADSSQGVPATDVLSSIQYNSYYYTTS